MTKKLYIHKHGRPFDYARHFNDLSLEAFIVDYLKDHPALRRKDLTFSAERPSDWPGIKGQPLDFVVFVKVVPAPGNGVTSEFSSRVGSYVSLERCHLAIHEDLKAMGETYGGLIAPVSKKGRSYTVFQSHGWTEHSVK